MNCPRPETLALYVGRDLPPGPDARLGAHLAACDACRLEVGALEAARTELRLLRAEGVDPASTRRTREGILAGIEAPESLGWAIRAERFVMGHGHRRQAAAGLGLLLLAGLGWGNLPHPESPATPVASVESFPEAAPPRTPVPRTAAPAPEATGPARPEPARIVAAVPDLAAPTGSARPEALPADLPEAPREQMLMKLVTDDPDIIIYWVLDDHGGGA
jgi:hypothetical protein